MWLGELGDLVWGEGKAPSFVRLLPESLKGARDIWEVGQFGGQLSRTHCKFSHFFCPATDSKPGVFIPKENVLRQARQVDLQKLEAAPVCQGRKRLMGPSQFWGYRGGNRPRDGQRLVQGHTGVRSNLLAKSWTWSWSPRSQVWFRGPLGSPQEGDLAG